MAKTNSPAIELNKVDKTYKTGKLTVPVLHSVDVTINKGEMVAIMGPSGSGKSTLMNIVGLLDRPTGGELKIDGQVINLSMSDKALAKFRGQKIGFVFQSFNLLPRLSALENVILPATYQKHSGRAIKERALRLLKQVGLEERVSHKPNELSGGEKQRVAIARSLINDPEVILADEPTGNLDSKSGKEVLGILQELQKLGKTVILITHDPKIADACERTIQILDGKISGGSNV